MRPWLLAVVSLFGGGERQRATVWAWNISKNIFE